MSAPAPTSRSYLGKPRGCAQAAWRILLVERDADLHAAIRYTLRRQCYMGRPVELVQASSCREAMELLETDRAFDLALLSVELEQPGAGLALTEYLRQGLQMRSCRILLTSAKPSDHPDLDTLARLDISDVRCRAELDHTRLINAIGMALREHEQLHVIAESRRGLGQIVQAASALTQERGLRPFAEAVLTQLAALLQVPREGLVCVRRIVASPAEPFVIGATGALQAELGPTLGQTVGRLANEHIREQISQALQERQHVFSPQACVLFLHAASHQAAVYLQTPQRLDALDQQMVEVFGANISACFDNINLIEELNYLAYHDALTGLGNRAQFGLDLAVAAEFPDSALLLLDVRRFADVNNVLGYEVGNAMLVAIARHLEAELLPACTLARLSGDVFGIVGPAAELSEARMAALFEAPLWVCEHPMQVSFAMASYALGLEPCRASMALQRASTALMRAKQDTHLPMVHFDPAMEDEARERLELVRRLRSDFRAGHMQVWYQPQIHMQSGAICGMEALLRWFDAEGRLVHGPDVFVPLAENSGLIVELGSWVLRQACADWRALQALDGAPQRVAVNVSMAQFRAGDLVDRVQQTIEAEQMPAGTLELEITESLAMDEPQIVRARLAELRALAVRVSVDDFGTGYSSLSQLKDLQVDALKIDRSFVQQIGHGKGDIYAETIVNLGRRIGLELVAEGVETDEQRRFLKCLGCETAQGWFYAKAMPLHELVSWIQAREMRAA